MKLIIYLNSSIICFTIVTFKSTSQVLVKNTPEIVNSQLWKYPEMPSILYKLVLKYHC